MCTSESEAEISLSSSISTTVPNTRKRSRISYTDMLEKIMYSEEEEDVTEEFEFGEGAGVDDSDEDFVATYTKKKKVSGGKSNQPSKKLTKSKNSLKNLTIEDPVCVDSCTSPTSPSSSNPPVVILKSDASDFKIVLDTTENLDIKNKEQTNVTTKLSGDINDNIAIEWPVVIKTPDQINSRSFDKEQEEALMTPSTTNPREEINYNEMYSNKQNAVERSLQFVPPVSSFLLTPSSEHQLQIASSHSIQQDVTARQISRLPNSGQHQPNICTRPVAPRGRAMNMRPSLSKRPPVMRQTTPADARPPIRPGTPILRPDTSMMNRGTPRSIMRALRPAVPARNAEGLNRPRVPGPRLPGCGSNLPNARPAYPYRQRSQSTPQYSSQFSPPVVELDVSPPRPDQVFAPSPPSSVVSQLASMGVSVARQNVPPPAKHDWVLPPGISVTKSTSNPLSDITLSLPSLAQALIQLGEVDGRKKIVQFYLTEGQIRALNVLGIKEDGAHSAKC